MTAKFFATGFAITAIMSFVNSLMQQELIGASDFDTILSFNLISWKEIIFIKVPVPNTDWFTALYSELTWDYFFFSDNLQFVRIIGGLWMMAGFLWGFFTVFLPVILRVVEATANTLRAINPLSG